MIRGTTVTVMSFVESGTDEMGEPIAEWQSEDVDNVLVAPSTTEELTDAQRANGDKLILTFHFPKTFTGSLRGCKIKYRGEEFAVNGDPRPYMSENCPTPWNRVATAEVVYG